MAISSKHAIFRILVVEDFEAFRRHLCVYGATSGASVAEASDGLEVVQKAEQMQPELVLLDIALPSLNGMEVGKRFWVDSPLLRKPCS